MENHEIRYFLGLVICRCRHSTMIVLVQGRPIRFGCSHQLGKQSCLRPVQRLHRSSSRKVNGSLHRCCAVRVRHDSPP